MVGIIITSIICATLIALAIIKDVQKQRDWRDLEKKLEESAKALNIRLTALDKYKDKYNRKE